jgi:hypothetical protein
MVEISEEFKQALEEAGLLGDEAKTIEWAENLGLISENAARRIEEVGGLGASKEDSEYIWVQGGGARRTDDMPADLQNTDIDGRGAQLRLKGWNKEDDPELPEIIVPPGGGGGFAPAGPDTGGPKGVFGVGGWFDDDAELDVLSEGGLPKFSEEELVYARNLLEAELRMAGFDTAAIGRLLEDWIIPRLTGTYIEETTGVAMLPPDKAEDLLPELFEQQEFKNRFPGYHQRLDAGYNAIDIQDYLSYETRFNELMVSYGLDQMIMESNTNVKEYVGDLIGGNISLEQVDQRISKGVAAVLDAPEPVLEQYEQWYGDGAENALLANFLDPDANLINLSKQAGAAAAGGYAKDVLGNTLTQELAEEIGDLDYTNQQLYQAYTALAQQTALFAEKAGEQDFKIEEQGVEYALNLDSETIQDMETRRRSRSADFQGGGGAMISGTTTGFGSANA